jgi:dTDP-4-dehydrorhamnose 3,5-epimerase
MSKSPQLSKINYQISDDKIFIVGANGQLGTALRQKYPNAKYADIAELDITSKESIASFDWSGIKILINAAAYTYVDGAETPEGRKAAWAVNADAVANLVAVAAQHDMTLVHISTDYVFDGTNDNHTEDEAFSPLSVYGASKAAGDLAVSLAPKFYILRTSWVIGEGKNFVRTMLELANKNISPTVVHDQIGRLTFTSELVRAIDHLLFSKSENTNSTIQINSNVENGKMINDKLMENETRNTKNAFPYGTYNVSNDGKASSWADITREIFKVIGRDDLTVTNISTEDYFKGKEGIAPRPLQSTLDLSKIQSTGFKSTDWQEELKSYINQQSN